MSVAIQSGTQVGWQGTQDSVSPFGHTVSITVGAGADRILLVGVQAVSTAVDNLSASFNGISLTKLDSGGAYASAAIFYLVNPPVGTHDLLVAYPAWGGTDFWMQAAVFEGVNQTTPLGANTKIGSASVATPLSSALTAAANDATFVTFAMYAAGTTTLAAGQVEIVAPLIRYDLTGYSSYKLGASSSVGCSWTGGTNQGAQLAVVLKAAAGGGIDANAPGGTGTSVGSGSGGAATGGAAGGGGDASAPGGTGTSTGSGTGGSASGLGGVGTFTSDAMENNTGAGLLASVTVNWTWYKGAIGTAPTSTTHGTGTTSAGGILSLTGLPVGAGFLLARTADATGVYYQPGTVA